MIVNRIPFYLLFLCCLMGCKSAHLYNSARHELALKAESAYEEVNLSGALDQEYELLESLLAQELEIVENQTLARRDARLWQIIGAKTSKDSYVYLKSEIEKRLKTLAGSPEVAVQFVMKLEDVKSRESSLEVFKDAYNAQRKGNDPRPGCSASKCNGTSPDDDELAKANSSPAARVAYKLCLRGCCGLQNAYSELDQLFEDQPTSEIGILTSEVNNFNNEYASFKKLLSTRSRAFSAKQNEYAQALKKPDSKIAGKTIELENKMLDLENSVNDYIEKVPEEVLAMFNFEAQSEKLDFLKSSVDELLGELINGDGSEYGPEDQMHLQVASFVKEFEGRIQNLGKPKAKDLLLESEFLRIEKKQVEEKIKNARSTLSLKEDRRDAMVEELKWLVKSYDGIATIEKDYIDCFNQPLFKIIDGETSNSNCKNDIDRVQEITAYALINYTTSWTLGRVPQEIIDYKIIHNSHIAALKESEQALKKWDALLQIPLSQIAEWEARGVKSEQISTFINAIGLGAVAVGVNK